MPYHERARKIIEAQAGSGQVESPNPLTYRGLLLADLGRYSEAIPLLEQTLARLAPSDPDRAMLTAPDDLPPETIVAALAEHWGLAVDTVIYRPVGWGSHHWAARNQWFVTVDELEVKRHTEGEALDLAYDRLRAALAAAAALPSSIVVAPVPARSGDPVVRCADRYAMAVYPYVEGQSYSWGEFSSPAHRQAVLDLLVRVHGSGVHSGISDDFGIAHRDALDPALPFVDSGPYARPTAELLAAHAQPRRYCSLLSRGLP
jgi:hypothetical protein